MNSIMQFSARLLFAAGAVALLTQFGLSSEAQAVEFTGAEVHSQYCDTTWLAGQGVSEYVGYYGVNAVFTKVRNVTTDSVTFDVYPSTTLVGGVCKANTSQSTTLDTFRVTYSTDVQAALSTYTAVDVAMTADKKFPTITISGLSANKAHYFETYYKAAGVSQGGNISSYAPSTIYTLPKDGDFTFDGEEIVWTGYTSGANLRVDLFDSAAASTGWLIGAQMGTTGKYDGYALTYADRAKGLLGVSVTSGPDALIKNERYYQWAHPVVGVYKKDSSKKWVFQGYLEHNCTGEATGVDNECIGAALKSAVITTDGDDDGKSDIAPVASSSVKELTKKKVRIKAVKDADYYEIIFRDKSAKGKQVLKFKKVKSTQKSISTSNFKKLKGKKMHVTIKACNEAGCSIAATKTKSF